MHRTSSRRLLATVLFRLPLPQAQYWKAYAEKHGLSLNKLMKQVMDDWTGYQHGASLAPVDGPLAMVPEGTLSLQHPRTATVV